MIPIALLACLIAAAPLAAQEEACLLQLVAAEAAARRNEDAGAAAALDRAAEHARHAIEPRLHARLAHLVAGVRERDATTIERVVATTLERGRRYLATGRLTLAGEFLDAVAALDERAHDPLEQLAAARAAPPPALPDPAATREEFLAAVASGDEARRGGTLDEAAQRYRHAIEVWSRLPADAERHRHLIEQRQPYWHEYTYYRVYDRPDGELRRLRALQFLDTKLALCTPAHRDADAVTLRVAALIVRDTDVRWTEDGVPQHERGHLDDAGLQIHRDAWQLATDAIAHWAQGRVAIETDWIELPGVTLRGLRIERWRELVDTRHLDPRQLDPHAEDALRRAVATHDLIVFVWPRGRAARAYGGGPRALPHGDGALPERGCVLSMPDHPATCVHEFLHNVEARATTARVHGPQSDWIEVFDGNDLRDEVAYYAWIAASVRDWRAARFLED